MEVWGGDGTGFRWADGADKISSTTALRKTVAVLGGGRKPDAMHALTTVTDSN